MLSEHDIDQQLKAALSVSPSAGFEARVLQRVEAERPSRRVPYGWLAAAASLVIDVGVFYAMNRTSVVVAPVPAPRVPAPQIVERAAPPVIVAPPETTARQGASAPARIETVRVARPLARTAPPIVAQAAPRTTEPEVLVPVNQMEAVRRLVRAVNEGRLEAPAEPPQGPMATPAELEVAPVEIKPIPLPPVEPRMESATPFIRVVK